jgi:hypothetical protein
MRKSSETEKAPAREAREAEEEAPPTDAVLSEVTMSVQGVSKVGKTWFAGTMPHPVFIAAAQERGWLALPSHPNWKNITVLPVPLIPGQEEIAAVRRPVATKWKAKGTQERNPIFDMEQVILPRIRDEYKERGWRTVVIDTTTLYAGMVVSQLSDYGKKSMWGQGEMNQWNLVQQHIYNIRNALHGLPLHVVWLFHTKGLENKQGKVVKLVPELQGRSYDRVIAPAMRIEAYLDKVDEYEQDSEGNNIIDEATGSPRLITKRRLWTSCPPDADIPFTAGSSFEHLLPGGCFKPDWAGFAKRLKDVIRVD